MTVNTSKIYNALRPGIQEAFFDFHVYKDIWSEIYTTHHSEKAVEYDQEFVGTPMALMLKQGEPTELRDITQGYTTAYYPHTYSIGVQFTRQAIVDNLYKDKVPMAARNLRNSLSEAQNVEGAKVLNNGFDPAFRIGDGEPLLSTQHPVASGVSPNTFPIPVGLNEASLSDANILLYNMRAASGIRTPYRAKKLIVGPANDFNASILTQSRYMPSSGTNAVNPIHTTGLIPEGYVVNPYLTAEYSWFLLTDCPVGFKRILRENVYFMINTDPLTQNVVTTASMRFAFGNSNWRSVVGSQGQI